MKILVTGGAGFVGSHLCDRLIADGHTVYCVDNLYTGSEKNIAQLRDNPNFFFYQLDITSDAFLSMFLVKEVDFVYNLACPASPVHYQAEPIDTLMTCFNGTHNCIKIARSHKCRIVHASTSEVYGDPTVHPQPESYHGNVNPIGPRACYDEGKRVAESLLMDYHRKHGVDVGIFRIFNTYGPRMARNDGRVVSNFIVAALSDGPLVIQGNGTQTRSFQYVDDLVEGIVRFADTNETGPMNLGNPGEFTISELAGIIISKINKGYITKTKAAIDDPKQRKPDISLAKEMLEWEPKVPLTFGLDETISYFRGVVNGKGNDRI
jgi:UDP-glucuronate decarboxylase